MYGIDFFMPEIKNRRDIRPCGLSVFLCFTCVFTSVEFPITFTSIPLIA